MYICKYISYELFDAMKKLTKLNIDALKNENPVLSTIEERMITGGGSGDCLYYSLSYVTGYSIDSIRDTYALYLYKLNCGDMGSIPCGGSLEGNALYKACVEMANSGVSSEHQKWLMDQYGFHMGCDAGDQCGFTKAIINYRYGETEGHSIVLEMNCGNMIYVDKQQNTSGNMVFMTDDNGASYFYMYGKKITDFMIFHNCGI